MNENKTPSNNNGQANLPPEWKLRLIMAWESGLKMVVMPLLLFIPAYIGFKYIPEDWVAIAVVGVLSLGLCWVLFSEMMAGRERSRASMVIVSLFIVCIFVASMYPVVKSNLLDEHLEHFVFDKVGDTKFLPAQSNTQDWWLLEVHGKLPDTNNSLRVDYTIQIENDIYKEKIKGEFDKSWKRTRVARRTRGKRLASHDKNVHHLTADLQHDTTFKLKKLDGQIEGPLEVFLRQEPVVWSYLLVIDFPLLLIAGLFEAIEKEKKNKLHFTWSVTFLTLFTTGFLDNYVPGSIASPIIIGTIMALFGSMIAGYLVPRIMKPLAIRLMG